MSAASIPAPAEGDSVPGLYERLAEAHDASLDDDHRACRSILTECMSLLAREPKVQPKGTAPDWQDIAHQLQTQVQEQAMELDDLKSSLDFYRRRCDALQACQSTMRDPERTMVCDILANGSLLMGGNGKLAAERYEVAKGPLTDEQIDLIAADGMRNAAGGIYETSVHPFARACVAAATQELQARITSLSREAWEWSKALEAQIASPAPAQPHGWVVWWPAMGGGHKPIYSHGPEKPNYGQELGSKLRLYPVYDAAKAPAVGPETGERIDAAIADWIEVPTVYERAAFRKGFRAAERHYSVGAQPPVQGSQP